MSWLFQRRCTRCSYRVHHANFFSTKRNLYFFCRNELMVKNIISNFSTLSGPFHQHTRVPCESHASVGRPTQDSQVTFYDKPSCSPHHMNSVISSAHLMSPSGQLRPPVDSSHGLSLLCQLRQCCSLNSLGYLRRLVWPILSSDGCMLHQRAAQDLTSAVNLSKADRKEIRGGITRSPLLTMGGDKKKCKKRRKATHYFW